MKDSVPCVKLTGTYADDSRVLKYVCRAFYYDGVYFNGINEELEIKDGDALVPYGNGTWFALYQPSEGE